MKIFWVVGLILSGILFSPYHLHAQEKKSFRTIGAHADTISIMHTDSAIESEKDIKELYRELFHIKQVGQEVDSVTYIPVLSFIPAIGWINRIIAAVKK